MYEKTNENRFFDTVLTFTMEVVFILLSSKPCLINRVVNNNRLGYWND